MSARIGIVGARGYAGGELLSLISRRGDMEVVYAASRAKAGQPLSVLSSDLSNDIPIAAPDPEHAAAAGLDALVLALPNGASPDYVAAIEANAPNTVLVDFSADHRFDDAWTYGLPEHRGLRERLKGARRIANPGCFATSAVVALGPIADRLSGPASVFAVSGYSGAGATPGPRNDVERLKDSVMPYALIGHGHEGEIRRHVGAPVCFSPHVAGFFRGIVATVHAPLAGPIEVAALRALYDEAYGGEPLITVQDEPPEVRDGQNHAGVVVGGFTSSIEESRVALTCALDNLLKGAASQALQNLALALGLDEMNGLPRR